MSFGVADYSGFLQKKTEVFDEYLIQVSPSF